ncbi:MAG: sulfur carrier protein ThiS [Colwellia sp.]|nr:sulfur carrier protein ThiS [Colwellia sp.]
MNIYINGQNQTINAEQTTLAAALSLFLNDRQIKSSFAVAVNGDFIGKDNYHNTALQANDSIDVLFPIVGG